MANAIETRVERIVDKDQWYDPCLLMAGNGNEDWARWATKWLYAGIVDFSQEKDSTNWPKYGIITQFDRTLPFSFPATPTSALTTPIPSTIPTNNRNWLLLSRAATAVDASGNNLNLALFNVSISVPVTTFLMEDQPAINTFGSGEWPHVMYFPEEWTQNVARTVTATDLAGVIATLTLNFKFLQVRTN
jgi:hypothetical protein